METLYTCVRCGYQLLPLAETEQFMAMPAPQKASSCETVGAVLYKRACRNKFDCARRVRDRVAISKAR